MSFEITVFGKPRSRGSKRAVTTKTGRTLLLDSDVHSRDWVDAIRAEAGARWHWRVLSGPVKLEVTFVFVRPKSHYGTGRNASVLKPMSPERHIQKPDIDKSLRGVLDALTGVVYRDDCQVCVIDAQKRWALSCEDDAARTIIRVVEL